MRAALFFVVICCSVLGTPAARSAEAAQPNILMIAIDDLNHWVGHLVRHPQAHTPNIDRLAASGVSFTAAYCTAPACNPSRASLMSGMRPSTTGCYENAHDWHQGIDETRLLNSHLASGGYRVYGAGKIFHGAADRGGHWDDYFDGGGSTPARHATAPDDGVGGIRFSPLEGTDEQMPDHRVVDWCIDRLREKSDRPFFIACGLVKPHMPFSVPKKWFDMHPLDEIQLPPWSPSDLDDVPAAGVKMAKPQGDHKAILDSGRWKEAVQAYLATCSFADYEVGRMLDGLEQSGHANDTLVVLWSDHGWSLGEKSHWRKFALWEEPTRTVFIWRIPGLTPAGERCNRPVDYLSVFPTLASLTGLERPAHLEGPDISPLLHSPATAWEHPAITTHGRGNHAVRTEQWRYIRYANGEEELYDHRIDRLEQTNVALKTEHTALKRQLASLLPADEAEELPSRKSGGRRRGRQTAEGE
jgi:arylsulfatase A-like enzyme